MPIPFALQAGVLASAIAAVANPLRTVSANNALPQTLRAAGANLGTAGKEVHYIGSGDVIGFRACINWAALGQNAAQGKLLPGNTGTVQELWLTKDGDSTGVQFTWGGATTKTVNSGDIDVLSDFIPVSALPGGPTSVARGSKVWMGYRVEVPTGGNVPSRKDYNPVTNSAIAYQVGAATINNLQGSGNMTWGGTVGGTDDSGFPIMLLGIFASGDKPCFFGIGDSIFDGQGDGVAGCFHRAMFDDYTAFTGVRAGLKASREGGDAGVWGATGANGAAAWFAAMAKYTNVCFDRYGINSIGSAGGQALATTIRTQRRDNIWIPYRAASVAGGRTPYVAAVQLSPKVQLNAGPYDTLAMQNPQAGCTTGETISKLDDDLRTYAGNVAQGPDTYILAESLLGSTDRASADYWKWAVSPVPTTGDGLHPNPAGAALIAVPMRTFAQSRFP